MSPTPFLKRVALGGALFLCVPLAVFGAVSESVPDANSGGWLYPGPVPAAIQGDTVDMGLAPDALDSFETRPSAVQLGAGTGLESLEGLVEATKRGLFGTDQAVGAAVTYGLMLQDYRLVYCDPSVDGTALSLGLELFRRDANPGYDFQGFDFLDTGLALHGGYVFRDSPWRLNAVYRYESEYLSQAQAGLFDTPSTFSYPFGDTRLSSFTPELVRDTRVQPGDPVGGSLNSLSMEAAGGLFGGDATFIKPLLDSRWFFDTPAILGQAWMRRFVLRLHGQVGWIIGPEDEVIPIGERFFVGGEEDGVRGYDERSLGASGVGGGYYECVVNAEYGYKATRNFELYVFYDAGNSWASDYNTQSPSETNLGSYAGINARLDAPDTWRQLYLYPSAGAGLYYDIDGSRFRFRIDWGYGLDANARTLGDVPNGRASASIGNIF